MRSILMPRNDILYLKATPPLSQPAQAGRLKCYDACAADLPVSTFMHITILETTKEHDLFDFCCFTSFVSWLSNLPRVVVMFYYPATPCTSRTWKISKNQQETLAKPVRTGA